MPACEIDRMAGQASSPMATGIMPSKVPILARSRKEVPLSAGVSCATSIV